MRSLWKRAFQKSVSVVLAALLAFAAMPAAALASDDSAGLKVGKADVAVQAVTPEKAAEAVSKFTDALSKFFADTSEMGKISSFLTRFGGVTAAVSGVIGILQMCGIIKDPTLVAIGEVLDTVHDIQDTLKQMDAKLDRINEQLVEIAVRQEEKDRNNNATTMLKYWRDFNTQYSEPLDLKMDEYQAIIDVAVKAWWEQGSRDGVNVLYTAVKTDDSTTSYELTYSSKPYSEGYPEIADNGEAVEPGKGFGLPAEYLPDTSKIKFDINTYQSKFTEAMALKFAEAADAEKLVGFDYSPWKQSDDKQKKDLADKYARDILNTLIYNISCKAMSDNHRFVVGVANAYKNYCNNVLAKDSGANAMLNAMYLTHGFEGEIKQDIKDFCDGMAVKAGVYGQFALTCVCQDDMQSQANREAVQALFTDTVISLYDRKDKALTGYDNYCYITGTLVEHAYARAYSTMTLKYEDTAYRGYSSTGWTLTAPGFIDSVYIQVLYDQYRALDQGKKQFSEYLKAYGAFPWTTWSGNIMTRYAGAQDFALNEAIRMKAHSPFVGGADYFKDDYYYNINEGNDSDVENKYFYVHDKVLYDAFNMGTGTLAVNQMAGARALYAEDHLAWTTDEIYTFATDGSGWGYDEGWESESDNIKWERTNNKVTFDVLKLSPVPEKKSDEASNRFFKWRASISDTLESQYEGSKTALTDMQLKGSTFVYTGKGIKPSVTVKAGNKTVPASGYEVAYVDNEEAGYASVVVKGKGDYEGSVGGRFTIVPKGTAIKKAAKSGTTATVKWKKQSAKMAGKQAAGYQIRYSAKPSMKGSKMVTVKSLGKTTGKIKGLKASKKYYFQVRTFVKGGKETLCSQWSKKKSAA